MDMTNEMYGAKTILRWPGTKWRYGLLDDYESVYPNLIKQAKGFPYPEWEVGAGFWCNPWNNPVDGKMGKQLQITIRTPKY